MRDPDSSASQLLKKIGDDGWEWSAMRTRLLTAGNEGSHYAFGDKQTGVHRIPVSVGLEGDAPQISCCVDHYPKWVSPGYGRVGAGQFPW